jgi:hypothetical protein
MSDLPQILPGPGWVRFFKSWLQRPPQLPDPAVTVSLDAPAPRFSYGELGYQWTSGSLEN